MIAHRWNYLPIGLPVSENLRNQIAATLAYEWGPSMTWTEVAELAIREMARYRESVSEDEFLDNIIEDEGNIE